MRRLLCAFLFTNPQRQCLSCRGPYINDLPIYHTRCVFFYNKTYNSSYFKAEFLHAWQHFCLPNLSPQCLQRLSADKTGRWRQPLKRQQNMNPKMPSALVIWCIYLLTLMANVSRGKQYGPRWLLLQEQPGLSLHCLTKKFLKHFSR